MQEFIKINREDTVAVALKPLSKGSTVAADPYTVVLNEDIPQGHKFAVCQIPEGAPVVKYGCRIGYASRQINPGDWVHIHNVRTALGDVLEYQYEPQIKELPKSSPSSFMGYKRGNGGCGVRNELWILPTVGCVNSVARAMEQEAKRRFMLGNVEDIVAFAHPYGCSQMGEDQENTRKVLADIIHHPNAGGVLVLGLGCENCNIPVLMDYIGEYDPERVKFLQCQDCEDEMEAAMELLGQLYEKASGDVRVECDASQLIIGMKCGGSDGLSGINGFKEYFTSHNQTIYENPSPGNKKGGISTLEDKSLGCTQKSGSSPVCGVLEYGERVREKGLNLLSAPGNDLVAATALAVSGAQIVLFTTGRGTPFATLVPTMKISSNSKLAGYKAGWIDFNAGEMVETKTKDQVAMELFQYVLRVASGEKVKSEEAGFHDLAIFKQGVTL